MPATDPIAPPATSSYAAAVASPPVADGGTVPLDAVARQCAQALSGPVNYELKGVTFALPSLRSLPIDLWDRVRAGTDPMASLRAVVGEQKMREMAAAGFTLSDLDVILEDWKRRDGVRH
ncbi:hypothetical protein [Streptomyces sp. NPDC014006]|uniref:hypothetical protein n=1 Tax=Streptomyces sp. NPDC014006 TaxID=3364870 RepID=UPI0036FA3E78